ncbi:MAG TPA: thioredoxin domain-containing protein [Polyangiaceae bacterium]|nr:thioredoxin domain-containing protein [Polyangiaceae bacterium]
MFAASVGIGVYAVRRGGSVASAPGVLTASGSAPVLGSAAPRSPAIQEEHDAPPVMPQPLAEVAGRTRQEVVTPAAWPSFPLGRLAGPAAGGALLPVGAQSMAVGTDQAVATLTLFGDLQCPYTRAALRTALRQSSRFGSALRVSFHHRPLVEHPLAANAAAILAAVAERRGGAAAFAVLAAAAQSDAEPSLDEIDRWLRAAGVPESANALLASGQGKARLLADLHLAAELSVLRTPTWFVNGRRLSGDRGDEDIERLVLQEGPAVRWLRAQGHVDDRAYALRVQKNLIGVEGEASDRSCVPTDAAPQIGPRDAPLTLVEFADFESGPCQELAQNLALVLPRYADSVHRVFYALPKAREPRSQLAAASGLAIRALSGDAGFWQVHAVLRSAEGRLDTRLHRAAAQLGLSDEQIRSAAAQPVRDFELKRAAGLAESLAIAYVPTFFLNGRRFEGLRSVAELQRIFTEELATARRLERAGTPPAAFGRLLCGEL